MLERLYPDALATGGLEPLLLGRLPSAPFAGPWTASAGVAARERGFHVSLTSAEHGVAFATGWVPEVDDVCRIVPPPSPARRTRSGDRLTWTISCRTTARRPRAMRGLTRPPDVG